MATVAELVAKIDADTRELRRELEKAGAKVEQFERKGTKAGRSLKASFTPVGVVMGTIAGILGGRLVGGLVSTITKFEQLEASLKTVTGSAVAANAAFKQIQNFAATTPFQLEEVVGSFIKLKALGLDPSEEAMRSYGNTASAMGKSLNQMIEAVADAATGEFERLKEFGIRAKSEGDRVTFTFQGMSTTVGKNASDIEGYLRSIGNVQFAGAMDEQADTLNVSISNLRDSWARMQKALGDAGFTDIAKNIVQWVTRMINAVTDFINNFDVFAVKFVGKLAEIAAKITAPIDYIQEKLQGMGNLARRMIGLEDLPAEQGISAKLKEIAAQAEITAEKLERTKEAGVGAGVVGNGEDGGTGNGSGTGTGVSDKSFPTTEELNNELQGLEDYFLTKEELELAHHERRLAVLQEMLAAETDLTAEQRAKLEELEEQHANVMAAKRAAQIRKEHQEKGKAFRDLISQTANSNKALFQLNKVAELSEAVLKGKKAIINAYEWGTAQGGPALGAASAAVAAAATASQISAIAGASFGQTSSGGGAGTGGSVSDTGTVGGTGRDGTGRVVSQPSTNVEIRLEGSSRYSDEEVRELITRINENISDNVRVNVA